MKSMLDRAAARGANLFAFHAFCYLIGGLRKWDAPPSEFEQNPYWRYFQLLSAYAGRLAYALSRGRRVAPVALVDPITSIWAHTSELGRDPVAQRVIADWTTLMRELTASQRPHDNLDPLLLAGAAVRGSSPILGDVEYQAVVLPSMTNLERAGWEKLEEFAASGGLVVAIGTLPNEDIEIGSDVVSRSRVAFGTDSQHGFVKVDGAAEVLRLLDERVPADIRLARAQREFLLTQRRDGDADLFFVANSIMEVRTCELILRQSGSRVTRLDLETGDAEELETSNERLQLEFPRHGAHLLLVHPAEHHVTLNSGSNDEAEYVVVDMDDLWECQLPNGQLNCLRLDRFRFTTEDLGDGPIIEPKPLINVLQDVTGAGQAWPGTLTVRPTFGAPPQIELTLPVTAWYEAAFEARYLPTTAIMCIEDSAISGDYEFWINGANVSASAFAPHRRWSIDNREVDVTNLLKPGTNTVRLRVRATQSWDGLLDAIYLLGDFGMYLEGHPVVDQAPTQLRWRDRHTSGYPYFSGTLRLHKSVAMPASTTRIRLSDEDAMFAGVVELYSDGQSLGVRAWAPYTWNVPSGSTEVTLEITNTLIEQLEGRRYDPRQRQAVPLLDPRTNDT